jgi:hypothetical protein
VFLGYSFLRFNSALEIPAFTANGGIATAGFNFTDHFGLELETGGYHNGNIHNYHLDTTSAELLLGPRVSLGRSKKIDPYIHVLFGGNYVASSVAGNSILVTQRPTITGGTATAVVVFPGLVGRYGTSQSNFAMAAGGGLDIKISKAVTFRPIQLDYYLTRFQSLGFLGYPSENRNQNNLRYATGFMFDFGKR